MKVMENNTNKEKWIDDVLGSVQGISMAQPRTGLYEQVVMKLSNPQKTRKIPLPIKQLAAAAMLLLALNVGSVIYFMTQNKKTAVTASEHSMAMEIQSVITYNY